MPFEAVWIVLVSDGTRIEYPPEVFAKESTARREAYRWAWSMSGSGTPSRMRSSVGWSAGIRDVLVIPAGLEGSAPDKCWVVAIGRGPIAGGADIEIASGRHAALESVAAWAAANGSDVAASPMGLWSGTGDLWIDAQRAKFCC
jgi:hypothetical protein